MNEREKGRGASDYPTLEDSAKGKRNSTKEEAKPNLLDELDINDSIDLSYGGHNQGYMTDSIDPSYIKWSDPLPLSAKVEPEPYPFDALPDTIRAAVEEVTGFVKAPIAMVASSALAALSLATQAHIDVKRAERLQGPTGLFLLTIADSGERKSTCDGFFTKAIHQYQQERAEVMSDALERHSAALDAWTAERDGLLMAIKDASKKGKPTDELRGSLADLQQYKPEAPKVPRLMYADATPEALAQGLRRWPSGGVVSAEAGIVFGSHGMGKESVMRNLATLNQLWDGASLTIDRKSTESFTVRGARLSVALQVQEATLREFFNKSGDLARGTGFLARFLVSWPESTQGYRPFTEAPDHWPSLAAFNRRISEILNTSVPMDEEGGLMPTVMTLSKDAKRAWISYHDEIESDLRKGGELYSVRDVASKTADNTVRLAALFQYFDHGIGAISAQCFERASAITDWHLNESRRFLGELALPREIADASRLDAWLIDYCKRTQLAYDPINKCNVYGPINRRYAHQHGPIRNGDRLTLALEELGELERLRQMKEGRQYNIYLNPAVANDPIRPIAKA